MGKIWILSDTHFGVKNSSKKWEDIMKKWMDDFFFPLIKENVQENDILIHLGDVFDNRSSVCLSTMSLAINFFERLSDNFKEILVLCGNHDAYYTNNNEITSIDCLKHIKNVKVIKEEYIYNIFNKNLMFISWNEDNSRFNNIRGDVDYIFCHSEFNGCILNSSNVKSENGFEITNVKKDIKVYSGHIHHRHKHKNITYVGSPYHLTQNDRGNTKGVYVINMDNGKEVFYKNEVTPQFMRIKYDDIVDKSVEEYKKLFNNKFVEIEIDNVLMGNSKIQDLISIIDKDDSIMNVSFVPIKSKEEDNREFDINNCVSIKEMLNNYIDEFIDCDKELKDKIKQIGVRYLDTI